MQRDQNSQFSSVQKVVVMGWPGLQRQCPSVRPLPFCGLARGSRVCPMPFRGGLRRAVRAGVGVEDPAAPRRVAGDVAPVADPRSCSLGI